MLGSLLRLLGVHSLSKHPTMENDWSQQLIDTKQSFRTETFLRDLILLAVLSPKPASVLCRFYVQSATLCKDPKPPRHELVVLELIDTQRSDSEPILLFLERRVSTNHPPLDYFSSHPDYATVLKSIVETLKEVPTSILESMSRPNDSESETSIPLLPLSDSTHTPYQPLTDEPEFKPSPARASPSLFDAATLAGTKVAHASMASSSTFHEADDRFTGSRNTEAYVPSLHVMRQLKFPSKTLSLFSAACLADSVHKHDPLYSPLQSHCLWFASIFIDVLERVCDCTSVHSTSYEPTISDDICIPRNNYLPDLAGRSMGILVSKVSEAVVSIVASNFLAYKEEKRTEVLFIINSDDNC